jgi:hypothetical protein
MRCNPCLEQPGNAIVPKVITPAAEEVQANALGAVRLNPFVANDNEELASK